jgi:hypothetical protein
MQKKYKTKIVRISGIFGQEIDMRRIKLRVPDLTISVVI